MNRKQIEQYLERIGLDGSVKADEAGLKAIQRAHLMTVPYENLDILRKAPMPLDEASLFDKVVTRRRGGYCFELNGLLGALLWAMGFEVEDYFARFLKDEPAIPMRRHRVLAVRVPGGGRYLVDVGVGLPIPREPLRLEENEQGQYALKREPFFGWVLYDRGRRLYAFTEEPQLTVDYEAAHFWCRFSPDSPFITGPMLAIRTAQGRITLDGDVLRRFTPEGVEEEFCPEGAAREAALRTCFGICL